MLENPRHTDSAQHIRFIPADDFNLDSPLDTSFVDNSARPETDQAPRTSTVADASTDAALQTKTGKPHWSEFRVFGFSVKSAAIMFAGLWGTVSASIFGARSIAEYNLRQDAEVRMAPEVANVVWPDNTKVFASTTQDQLAYFYSSYSHQLAKELRKESVQSLSAAQENLESNGLRGIYRVGPQIPVSTPREQNAWDKREIQDRRAVFFTGSGDGGPTRNFLSFGDERRFLNQVDTLAITLQDEFTLTDAAITKVHAPTVSQIEETLQEVASSFNGEGEVLIYIAAHGDRTPGQKEGQGSHNGILCFQEYQSITEDDLKNVISKHFDSSVSVSIIIDACYSGAFIS